MNPIKRMNKLNLKMLQYICMYLLSLWNSV